MEQISLIQVLFGSVTSLLLSIVAYFIRQLHSDFRKMELDMSEVKTMTKLIKTEFNSRHDLLCQRIEYLEKRIGTIEHLTFKEHPHESKRNEPH